MANLGGAGEGGSHIGLIQRFGVLAASQPVASPREGLPNPLGDMTSIGGEGMGGARVESSDAGDGSLVGMARPGKPKTGTAVGTGLPVVEEHDRTGTGTGEGTGSERRG